jgi:cyclohexanone monooxygenase
VFQRTPNFSIPSRNGPMTKEYAESWKSDYPVLREKARHMRTGILNNPNDISALEVSLAERQRIYEERWAAGGTNFMAAFNDLILSQQANDTAADFVRNKIRATVRNQNVAELLAPKNHPIGTKRICVDTDYYGTYNRDNVALVDVWTTPITRITANGVQVGETEYRLDAIVFATGFDAMTGALLNIDIEADGQTLREKWEAGPLTYLGLMTAGFPNMFMITGPGSPSVLSNMMVSIEQHVDWITGCVAYLRSRGLDCIEATQSAEDAWVQHGNEVAQRTLYPLANSWYMGVNVPGKSQVFMPYIGGVGAYRQICDNIAAEAYRGFNLSAQTTALAAE